jgi:predicted PurR-regulated permease PerM
MSSDATQVPAGLRVAAAWTWRVLLLGVGIYALARVVAMFQLLVAPVLIALLLVALIRPLADAIGDIQVGSHRLPRSMAALLTMLVSLAAVVGLMTMIGQQVTTGFPSLRDDAVDGVAELQRQLANSPLHLSSSRLDNLISQATASVQSNSDRLVSGALAATSTAGHVLAGFFLVMFSSYFFLAGGDRIWTWMVRLFPRTARARVDESGRRAWATLTSFVRATMIVALVDALGVGIVAAILGVPLALPLGVLVFLGAFVPIVGALLSGSVAVLVALVAQGPVDALLMLAGVLVVQQVESHVLQPFLLGRAVQVHPLAVILAIAAGVLLAGIAGALFAVPLLAVINVVAAYLSGEDAEEHAADPEGERASEVQIDTGVLGDNPDPQPPVGAPRSEQPSRT